MEGLLEIDSLSEQDRDIILQVLKRDDEVRKTQELKANQLKVEIQSLRMQSVLRPGDDLSKMCARCHGELGVIFNRGDICPKCRFRVCNQCKEKMFKGSWLCNLCYKQRQLKWLTGEWAGGQPSGLRRWSSGTDLVKASIIYKDHPPLSRKQDVIIVKQKKLGVVSSLNNSGPRAMGGQDIRRSPAKAANNTEVQKEHTNGVVSAQEKHEAERVEYPKETDKQRLSQLLNFIRAGKPTPVETQENSREMSVRKITSRNYSESESESSSSSSETDDMGSSYQPSIRSSSVSPTISELEYDVQVSESTRLQSVHEENIDTEGDSRNKVVKPPPFEQLTLELSAENMSTRDVISPREKSKHISDQQKSEVKPDVSADERRVKPSPSSMSGKSNASSKMSVIATSCDVHASSQSDQSQQQITTIQGDSESLAKITSADLPLGRSSSPISVSMDSLPSSHPSPSMICSYTADFFEKGSMHDTSDTESISRASQPEMTEFSGTESVVQEGSADDDYVLEEISKVKFRRISQQSKHSDGKGPGLSPSPQRPSRPEGFTAEVEGPKFHSGLQRGSEKFEEGGKETKFQDPFHGSYSINSLIDPRSKSTRKVSHDLSINAVEVDTKTAQDSEIKISQLSQLQNMPFSAVGRDPTPNVDLSTHPSAHPHQQTGSHLLNTTSYSVHGSIVDVVNSPACDNFSAVQSSFNSHILKHINFSSKDDKEITQQKGSEVMTLLDITRPRGNPSVSERSASETDSIGSFNLSPISPIPPSALEANTGAYTITYFDSDDALEDPAVEEPENDDYVKQWAEELQAAKIDERPQDLKLNDGQSIHKVTGEIDYIGIKHKVISDCPSLWHVQGVDMGKEEFDSLFNQEEKIIKSSKGGYLTRSSSEDSDMLSVIEEKEEEEEKSVEEVEEKEEEQFSYNANSANEGRMLSAFKPDNNSAFVGKEHQSYFSDVPEIRDSSSVVFAEHSVKINQEISNEDSFISVDLSNLPDISLDDILAVNRKMSAVGDSDDGDLEEILAHYRESHQESPEQHKKLLKPKKSCTSKTEKRSPDFPQMKNAIEEEATDKEQVHLSGASQHPHELTVFARKEFFERCLLEPSILNEETRTRKDAAKSASNMNETLQHPTKVVDIKEEREEHIIKEHSRAVSDEKSLLQVRAEHSDEVVRELKEIALQLNARPVQEKKQIQEFIEVQLCSEWDDKSQLFSGLKVEGHQSSGNLHENYHRKSPTDQSSERVEYQISREQNTRVLPLEEEVDVQVEKFAKAKTTSICALEELMNKLPQKRAVIEEGTVVQDLEEHDRTEKSSKNITEKSDDYISFESQVNSAVDSAYISEQMFVSEEQMPTCADYVIQPPEEFSDSYNSATSSTSQHQAPQQDADYLSQLVPEDDADTKIKLILKDPQTLEDVIQKSGGNWDQMDVKGMKAEVVFIPSSSLDDRSEEFLGKVGKMETSGDRDSGISTHLSSPEVMHSEEKIVNKTDSTFHPPQNPITEPQDGEDELFSFQESSKACFPIPIIDVDIVETEKRISPLGGSESSASQEDSGHASLPTSIDHRLEHKRTDSGYSQSSIPSIRSTVTDRSEEEDIDTVVASAKSNVSSRGNLLSVIADSHESIVSYYSDAGDISHGNIPVTGEVLFGLNYNYKTGMLEIAVKQCKDIAPADTKRNRSDPYVKTYLLPDKTRSGKRKTKVKKHTLSPVFDEFLKYSVSKSELENRTLWLSVWHNDRFGRNDFLGEVTINFDYYKFDDPTPKWYPLQERMDSQQPSMLTYKGDLILSICFLTVADNKTGQKNVDSSKGQLHVMIKEAHNLTAVKSSGYSDPFCKGYLLPERQRNSKQKTPVVKKNCNPVWNYKMVFEDMSRAELAERSLELTIWDHEKLASNDFLGGVRLNLGTGLYRGKLVDWMDSRGEEISLWQAILDHPNLWIDSTLILRPNMQKRKF